MYWAHSVPLSTRAKAALSQFPVAPRRGTGLPLALATFLPEMLVCVWGRFVIQVHLFWVWHLRNGHIKAAFMAFMIWRDLSWSRIVIGSCSPGETPVTPGEKLSYLRLKLTT